MSLYMDGVSIAPIITSFVIENVNTAQGMADKLTSANVGRMYRYTGTTTANYVNGRYYMIVLDGAIIKYKEYLAPEGNQAITTTAQIDVKDKATAQIVEANLIPDNIKKDINILGITGTFEGGGGGGGFNVYFRCRGYDDGNCRINDNDDYDFKATNGYNNHNAMITPPNGVTKIKFYNFDHTASWPSTSGGSWVRWRPHASNWETWDGTGGQDLVIGKYVTCTELTLTGDIDILASYATCLTGDTLILMADGSLKRLDHIYMGDKVIDGNGEVVDVTYCDSDCNKWHNVYNIWTFDDGTIVKTIHPHRFYNADRKAFVYMDQWNIGDHAVNKDGKEVALIAHDTIEHDMRHYTIFTSGSNTYYANGLLSGNRNSVLKEGWNERS